MFAPLAQSQTCDKLDLSNFSVCSSTTVPSVIDNLSGVCYNYQTKTLFAVVNNPELIVELDLNGNALRTITLNGFWDTESIAYMGNSLFAVGEERNGRIVFITIPVGTVNITINYPGAASYIQMSGTFGTNKGLEGLAYNYLNDTMYTVREKDTMDIYAIGNPLSLINTTQTSYEVFDLEVKAGTYPAVSGAIFEDAAGLSFTPYGTLLILTEDGKAIVEVDANDGTLLSSLLLPAMTQPEGLIAISSTEIIVVGEANEFVFYSSNCATPLVDTDNDGIPDATDNCPLISNAEQKDVNMNGIGDLCDGTYTCTNVTTNTWVGPMEAFWYDDACYWSKGEFPNPCDDVIIDAPGTNVIVRAGSTAYGKTLDVALSSGFVVEDNATLCIEP